MDYIILLISLQPQTKYTPDIVPVLGYKFVCQAFKGTTLSAMVARLTARITAI